MRTLEKVYIIKFGELIQFKGYENKHYFGPACGDNTSFHWYERKVMNLDMIIMQLGRKEGIEVESEGDIFDFEGMLKPHKIKRV